MVKLNPLQSEISESSQNNTDDLLMNGDDEDIPQIPLSDDEKHYEPMLEGPNVVLDFDEPDEEPLFSPPLYLQRYCHVEDVIAKYAEEMELKSIVDMGCSEMRFLIRAKNGMKFERIVGVDRDEFLVGSNCRRIQPGAFEFSREKPLKMEVYAGDCTLPDARLLNIDVVSAIELIEHMELKDHVDLARNIFDVIQPKLAIITTPNVEYNVLFPNGSVDQRRHWDHRFEWTRNEFETWCKNEVVKKYPAYSVEIGGIGNGPPGTLVTHGLCSQVAVFVRRADCVVGKRRISAEPYKLISSVDYPWSPPKTPFQTLLSILDGECYEYSLGLQQMAESEGRFYEEYFSFTLQELYNARWRLIDLAPTGDLTEIRLAICQVKSEWLKFNPDTDTVTYRLLQPEDNFPDSPDLDIDGQALGFPADGTQEEQELYELTDPTPCNVGEW